MKNLNTLVVACTPHTEWAGWFMVYFACGHSILADLPYHINNFTCCQLCKSTRGLQ